jgi:hypothetical protein
MPSTLRKKKNNVGVRFDLVLQKENTLINMHMIIPADRSAFCALIQPRSPKP